MATTHMSDSLMTLAAVGNVALAERRDANRRHVLLGGARTADLLAIPSLLHVLVEERLVLSSLFQVPVVLRDQRADKVLLGVSAGNVTPGVAIHVLQAVHVLCMVVTSVTTMCIGLGMGGTVIWENVNYAGSKA